MRKSSVGEIEKEAFKRRKDARFDGTGAAIKKIPPPNTQDLKPFEERYDAPKFGENAKG